MTKISFILGDSSHHQYGIPSERELYSKIRQQANDNKDFRLALEAVQALTCANFNYQTHNKFADELENARVKAIQSFQKHLQTQQKDRWYDTLISEIYKPYSKVEAVKLFCHVLVEARASEILQNKIANARMLLPEYATTLENKVSIANIKTDFDYLKECDAIFFLGCNFQQNDIDFFKLEDINFRSKRIIVENKSGNQFITQTAHSFFGNAEDLQIVDNSYSHILSNYSYRIF